MPASPGEAHVVIDLPDTPKMMGVNSERGGHPGEKDGIEEDQDIHEGAREQ